VSVADVAAFVAAAYNNRPVLDVLALAATKLISNRLLPLGKTH
jgi:hypothetical protein